ncbi:MAG: hypothetical protein Q8N98_02095 [bacterium]|nr:hypothetical protein [bacterium]
MTGFLKLLIISAIVIAALFFLSGFRGKNSKPREFIQETLQNSFSAVLGKGAEIISGQTFSSKVSPKEIGKIAESLPSVFWEKLPQVEELLSPTRKEELYLVAAKNVFLPEIRIQTYDQELTVQLDPFEIKNNRGKKGWRLVLKTSDLVGEKAVIAKENLSFRLKKEETEVLEGNEPELEIRNGSVLEVNAPVGKGVGRFRFRPQIIVTVPQGAYAGLYKGTIESVLE